MMASRIQPAKEASRQKRPRVESTPHLVFIRSLPCCVCGLGGQTEAAHIRIPNPRFAKQEAGVGAKPDDTWTVPLCSEHHRLQHSWGERAFWFTHPQVDKDPFILALALWRYTGDLEAAMICLENAL
jgi:hypothetical protein